MADNHHRQVSIAGGSHPVSGAMAVCASLAGVAVGGPLLGMTGFSFLATVTLLLISSPLLMICSPVIICAALVLAGAVGGFTVAAVMGVSGVCTIGWLLREVRGYLRLSGGVWESVERVKDKGKDWADYFQQKVYPHDNTSDNIEVEEVY